jgi:hypothetical protein
MATWRATRSGYSPGVRRWTTGPALLLGLLLVGGGAQELSADEGSVAAALEMLRFDPRSPAAPIVLARLGRQGGPGFRALTAVVREFEGDGSGLDLAAAEVLVGRRERSRLDEAARALAVAGSEAVRARLVIGLAESYPERADLLHAYLRRNDAGSVDLLRRLAGRGLPRAEVEQALRHESLAGLARDLLEGRAPAATVADLVPRAREVARAGLEPERARAFQAAFAAAPSRGLLSALVEVLRDADPERRAGAHALLLAASGMDLPEDAALWHSWIEGRGAAYEPPDPVSPGGVRAAVLRGVRSLRRDLETDGRAVHAYEHAGDTAVGATALAIEALLAAGLPPGDPVLHRAVEITLVVRDSRGRAALAPVPRRYETYSLALLAGALGRTGSPDFRGALEAARDRLVGGMLANGQWTYASTFGTEAVRPPAGDNSNTQYANLGLRELRASGLPADETTWARVEAHWRGTQQADGAWGYRVSGQDERRGRLQMTASGIAGIALALEARRGAGAGARIASDPDVARGLSFLGRQLLRTDFDQVTTYSLYAVERACQLTRTEAFAGSGARLDWFREGAWRLLRTQNEDGSWGSSKITSWERQGFGKAPSTAFALLFLSRATATVGGAGEGRTIEVATTPQVAKPPASRAPAPGGGAPIPWREEAGLPPPGLAVLLDDVRLATRTGRVVVSGRVEGRVERLAVDGRPADLDESGTFSVPLEVEASRDVRVLATGEGGAEVTAVLPVAMDQTPPVVRWVGPAERPPGRQRVRLEADEELDGVRAGRQYFPAEGSGAWVTVELRPGSEPVAVTVHDRAGNEAQLRLEPPGPERVLSLDGSSALRVALPAKPAVFTLECWLRVSEPERRAVILGDTENAGMGLFLGRENGGTPEGWARDGGKYVVLRSDRPLRAGRWSHAALTFDGALLVLWLDGRRAGEGPVGAWRTSARSLYVGAQPDAKDRPEDLMTGSLDEVRLSDMVRYLRNFDPPYRHLPDANTLLLLPFDAEGAAGLLDTSGRGVATASVGTPVVVTERR